MQNQDPNLTVNTSVASKPRPSFFGKHSYFSIGFQCFLGALSALAVCMVLAQWIPSIGIVPYDDTDPPGARSGLIPYTDALTGCQYLAVPATGVTPRLDVSGKHICNP